MDALAGLSEGLDWGEALVAASRKNDLLPRRPDESVGGEVANRFVEGLQAAIQLDQYVPEQVQVVAVPKSRYVTRPAAVSNLRDRTVYHALTAKLAPRIEDALVSPDIVFAHRAVGRRGRWTNFQRRVLRDEPKYVVRADIVRFYEYVEHDALRARIAETTGERDVAEALEWLLDAMMGGTRGLPQGMRGSDTLASLFLIPVDRAVLRGALSYARYGDDIRIAAESYDHGRIAIARLEDELRRQDLALNEAKTAILKAATYESRVEDAEAAREELQQRLLARRLEALKVTAEEAESLEELEDVFTDELLWDLYAERITIEEAVEQMGPLVAPDITEVAERLFKETVAHAPWKARNPLRREVFHGRLYRALLYLGPARSEVPLDHLEEILYRAPDETENFARYLRGLAESSPDAVREGVEAYLLRDRFRREWQDVWLYQVLEDCLPTSEAMREHLRATADGEDRGWLARTHAALLLAKQGIGDRRVMDKLWDLAPRPFRAEVIAAAGWLEGQTDWSDGFLEGCRGDPVHEVVLTHVRAQRRQAQ